MERDSAGATIMEGCELLVKTTASKLVGNKLIVISRAVTWWDNMVGWGIKETNKSKEKGTREIYSRKTTTG